MARKCIPVFLIVLGFIVFAIAADAPCNNKPYTAHNDCLDHKGKFIHILDRCLENEAEDLGTAIFVQCIKPGHAFDSRAECEEKCPEAIKYK